VAVVLEGGCRVTEMREGMPVVNGTLKIWQQVGRSTGSETISLRILEFAPGLSNGIRNRDCDEILYMLEDLEGIGIDYRAKASIDGWPYEIEPQTGIYIRPGQTFTVNNPGSKPVIFISSQCPEPSFAEIVPPNRSPDPEAAPPERPPIVRLSERGAVPTADRWYRVLVDAEVGSTQVTQFVGSIPRGRAPDHFHDYEEVLFILRGHGRMWAGGTNTNIAPGSCVYLPKGQVHCVENTGTDELRLLGVFYPAGSPSVRYDV
jgi:mannose-6-phosphate isomerase-like protein (cupin superfamily)